KWLPLMANSLAVSVIVIMKPGVGRQHGRQPTWVHHPLDRNFEEYQKVTEVINVENWQIDKSRVLRWVVSLIVWNSFVLSTKSSIQSLRMLDSHTGNHPEDDFTPLETIQRLCSVFGRRSHLGFEGETSEPKGRPPSPRGDLRAEGEGTSSNPPVECNVCIYKCIAFDY
ncbi:hypothetical protein Tco_0729141, partial [Tanacetum coccineum]